MEAASSELGALYIDYNWRIVQGNTNICVMFCLSVTVLSTCGSSGRVCFKGVVVTDIQVTGCHLCKPRDGVHEG